MHLRVLYNKDIRYTVLIATSQKRHLGTSFSASNGIFVNFQAFRVGFPPQWPFSPWLVVLVVCSGTPTAALRRVLAAKDERLGEFHGYGAV